MALGGAAAAFGVKDGLGIREGAASGEAHHHEEGVDVLQVLRHGPVQVVDAGGEVLAGNDFVLRVLDGGVGGAVLRIDLIVDGILRELCVELARLAVQAQAAVVVDAVGDVGSLLDLGDEAAAADGVDASGREEEHVAGMHVVAGQHLGDGAVRDALLVFLRGDFLGHAGEQVRARLRIDHIPHFGLPLGAVVPHGGQLVVRMDLHGQVGEGVDELDRAPFATTDSFPFTPDSSQLSPMCSCSVSTPL